MIVNVKLPRERSNARKRILSCDVGATKINIGLFDLQGNKLTALKKEQHKSDDIKDMAVFISQFLGKEALPDAFSLGVAGPVINNEVKITNTCFHINAAELSAKLKGVPVFIINDLEATAFALAVMNEHDISALQPATGPRQGNIAVIAPGTGLGEAGLLNDGKSFHPFATEGGHADFGPRTDTDVHLFQFLQKRFGHISWERVVSGHGICNIYNFLLLSNNWDESADISDQMLLNDMATVISSNALKDKCCAETMRMFFRFLAEEASNLVLKLKATGGVFIGGGIIPKVMHLIDNKNFLHDFQNSGRMRSLLENVPIDIILNEEAALLGAAYYGANMN